MYPNEGYISLIYDIVDELFFNVNSGFYLFVVLFYVILVFGASFIPSYLALCEKKNAATNLGGIAFLFHFSCFNRRRA